jgi:DNA-binding FrmR family transcriptional regulator
MASSATDARPRPERTAADESDPRTRDILSRLKSVEGHVRGVGRMVDEGAYCMDVVNQILAVQRALKKVTGLVLDRHLHSCAMSAIRGEDPDERERVIREILSAFEAAGRT